MEAELFAGVIGLSALSVLPQLIHKPPMLVLILAADWNVRLRNKAELCEGALFVIRSNSIR